MRDQDRPTWVIRMSGRTVNEIGVAYTIARTTDNGADVQSGIGVWESDTEPSVTITMQSSKLVLHRVLKALSEDFGECRWVHVEEHHPHVSYIDLDMFR